MATAPDFNSYDPLSEPLPFESLKEGNPTGVNLANAVEAIGFKVGACGDTVQNVGWVDVIFDENVPKENLEQGLAKRGFIYTSSEVCAKDESVVRVYARKMSQIEILSENSLKIGPGNSPADVQIKMDASKMQAELMKLNQNLGLLANINKSEKSKEEQIESDILDVIGELNLHKMSSVVVDATIGSKTNVEIRISFVPTVDFIDGESIVNRLATAGHRMVRLATASGEILNTLKIAVQYKPGWAGEMGMIEETVEWMNDVKHARQAAIEKCLLIDPKFWGGGVAVNPLDDFVLCQQCDGPAELCGHKTTVEVTKNPLLTEGGLGEVEKLFMENFQDNLMKQLQIPPEVIGIAKADAKKAMSEKIPPKLWPPAHFQNVIVEKYLDGKHGNQEPFTQAFKSMTKNEADKFMGLVMNLIHKANGHNQEDIKITSISPALDASKRHVVRYNVKPDILGSTKVMVIDQKDLLKCVFESHAPVEVVPDPKHSFALGQKILMMGTPKGPSIYEKLKQLQDENKDELLEIDPTGQVVINQKVYEEQVLKKMVAQAKAEINSDAPLVPALDKAAMEAALKKNLEGAKIVGVDLAGGVDEGIILETADGGKTYSINPGSLQKQEYLGDFSMGTKVDAIAGPGALVGLGFADLKQGEFKESVNVKANAKLIVMRQGNSHLICLIHNEQSILSMAIQLKEGAHTLEATLVTNKDGSQTYMLYADAELLTSAQRANQPGPLDIKIEEGKIDAEHMLQFKNLATGQPIMTITKDGRILVNISMKLFFEDIEANSAYAAEFWKCLAANNPLLAQLDGYKKIAKKMMLKISELQVEHNRAMRDRELAKKETPFQTRIRHIAESDVP